MFFVHPILLGGLVLAGIPVLLHLIMRQQPKHLLFPAVRFLMQRHRTNQRKLQLRHLLLLALRIFLIAAMCLALARPRVFSEGIVMSTDRPVAAVLVFDSSYSMEYTAGRTRLDEAKRRAQELLDDLSAGSRVAVLDTAEPGDDWLASLSLARERVAGLQLRPNNAPVTGQLPHAYGLLAKLEQERASTGEALLPFVYVFSDRTQASWDQRQVENLQRLRDQVPGVSHVFVDVGVERPADLAVASLELPRQVVPANEPVVFRATVQATGGDYDTELVCRVDGQQGEDRKPVKLKSGQRQVVSFERRGLSPGVYQAEVGLASTDSLAFDNTRFATFEVRGPRKVLTVTDDEDDANAIWKPALELGEMPFECQVLTVADALKLTRDELAGYKAVCLLSVAQPPRDLWDKLERFVRDGGGLAVIPGGAELKQDAYNSGEAQKLLPGQLQKVVEADPKTGVSWDEASYQEPVKSWFRTWRQDPNIGFLKFPPKAFRYWQVGPGEALPVAKYADKEDRPALLERRFDRQKVRGRALLLTVPLDDRRSSGDQRWHNYLREIVPFYLALVKKTVGYLGGDAEDANFNYQSGQAVPVPLPALQRAPTYTVQGPGLNGSDALVQPAADEVELRLTQPVMPGHYGVFANGKRTTSFSVNVAPEECQLARVPAEQIEALFGKGALLPVDYKTSLRDALQAHWSQPVELLPWLMILLLVALAVENLLANKFYRQPAGEEGKLKIENLQLKISN
jgi:hypothetical protein